MLFSASAETKVFSQPEWDKNKMYLNMILDFEGLINNKPNQCATLADAQETVSLIANIKSSAFVENKL